MLTADMKRVVQAALDRLRDDCRRAWARCDDPVAAAKWEAEIERIMDTGEWIDDLPLMPQPNWQRVPDWVQWATVAVCGTKVFVWRYHEVEPTFHNDLGWCNVADTRSAIGSYVDIPFGIDPRMVKVRRPRRLEGEENSAARIRS